MKVITESNFLTVAKQSNILLIEFKSELCAPCIRQDVVLESLESRIKNGRITFGEVDIDEHPILEAKFKIEATPTLILITEGKIIGRHEGHLSEPKLKSFINTSIKEFQNRLK